MRKFRNVLMMLGALSIMGTSQALADLKIGIAAEPYPPFTSQDPSGKWVGWEIDFINALCTQMNEKCEITGTAWDGIIPALSVKKIDVILASMSITAKRQEIINFSNPYYSATPLMIGAKDGDADISPEHLAGKTIGVQAASIHANYASKYFSGASTVKEYPTQDEANQDLVAGRVDYVLANGLALDSFLKSEPGVCCEGKGAVPPDVTVLGEGVGLGLRKEDVDLQARINVGISALAAAGTFAKITEENGLTGQIILPAK